MSHKDQEKKLVTFIKDSLLQDKSIAVASDTLLFKQKILDSMNILDLIGYIEHRLNRRLKDQEIVMSNFQSVEAISSAFFNE